ncbi:MAG: hypothetical protein WCQ52_08265 [Actinomycetes bacterium]
MLKKDSQFQSLSFFAISAVILSFASFVSPASAATNTDPYLRAQTKITYSLYKPVNTLGFAQTDFKVLVCGGGGENWVYAGFSKAKKHIDIMQTKVGAHCSNPGLSVKLPSIKINDIPAQVFAFCDPRAGTSPKTCSTSSINKVGGYLTFILPGYYKTKPVSMQVQVTGGVTYAQMIAVARSLTPASTKASG